MRILWVRRGKLLPVVTGGRIRSVNTLRELARRHDVRVVSSYRASQPDRDYETSIEDTFPGSECHWIGWPKTWGGLKATLNNLSLRPAAVRDTRSAKVASSVRGHLESGSFDVAVCDFLDSAANFPTTLATPTVLFEHNVETDMRREQARCTPNLRDSTALRYDAWRLSRFEPRTVARFDHTIAVSNGDADRLLRMSGSDHVTPVRTGVDLDAYTASPLPDDPSPLLVYTALMSYQPNIDAMRWFCAESWPLIVAAVPAARFRIVGRNPAPEVLALRSESVDVTGEVESVAKHLRAASLAVVPLRAGSGTRLKIFEAMAAGRPVVSTSLGAVGLDVKDGHDIVLADDADGMASECIELLRSRSRAQRIGAAAARTAATHAWPEVAKDFECVLESVVQAVPRR